MRDLKIRIATEEDAAGLIDYISTLRAERLPTIFRYDEVPTLPEEVEFVRRFTTHERSAFFVACIGDQIVGNLGLFGGRHPQTSHIGSVGMAVLQPFRTQGIGSRLLDEAIKWAPLHGIRKLELEVLSNNDAARRLYEQKGFSCEGCRRDAVLVDGTYVHAFMMARSTS